jgi:type IV pilus assembly protein PilM
MRGILDRIFPTPKFFTIPTVGLNFSDATLRFVELVETRHGIIPGKFFERDLPVGCIQNGRIMDEQAFTNFLRQIRMQNNLKYVRVAMPESQVYASTIPIDIEAKKDIKGAIELVLEDNIPLKIEEAVFDYQVLFIKDTTIMVQVIAVAQNIAEAYSRAFTNAGMVPVSFELDGQAISRAVLKPEDKGSYMIIDFSNSRTSIAVVTNNTAVYTSTIDFGGKNLTNALIKELGVTPEEAEKMEREYGMSDIVSHKELFAVLIGGISTLKDEINRRYIYWHEKKNQGMFPNIETIYLCGGHSNLKGLVDYLRTSLKINVVQVNPWINCLSFDEAIPKIPFESSMSYATAIGLALVDYIYD